MEKEKKNLKCKEEKIVSCHSDSLRILLIHQFGQLHNKETYTICIYYVLPRP